MIFATLDLDRGILRRWHVCRGSRPVCDTVVDASPDWDRELDVIHAETVLDFRNNPAPYMPDNWRPYDPPKPTAA